MLLIIPLVFGAIGTAVGAVASAFVTHATGEKDREAAKHHRQVANELTNSYNNLKARYQELEAQSQQQILGLTQQRALDAVEKDALRLALRLQQAVISLMTEIDREPTVAAINSFRDAIHITNNVLAQLGEESISIPNDYWNNNLIKATKQEERLERDRRDYGEHNLIEASQQEELLERDRSINIVEEPEINATNNNMFDKDFQLVYSKIYNIGKFLLQYLQEVRNSRLKEGNDTKGLQSIEDSITKAIAALTATKTVAYNSDWTLLSNALVEIIKAAKAVEDTLFVEIQGWEIEIGQLKAKIAEYKDKERSELARPKAIYVKKSIEAEKEIWLL